MISIKDIPTFEETERILSRGDEYLYVLPHPQLKAYISNYTITFPTREIMSDNYTVLPHGSGTLVIECAPKNLIVKLWGAATKPDIVGCSPAELLVIIEFQPAGLYAFTSIHQSELTDKEISLEAINPIFSRLLVETVEKSESVLALVKNLDLLLLKNMHTAYHPQLNFAFQRVIGCGGDIAVKRLAGEVCYSERQLNRIFKQYVGTNTKTFVKLVRMNNACRLLQNGHISIELISELTGFHDPAHFVRDFKSICGVTPQTYRANVSDYYNEIAKFSKYNLSGAIELKNSTTINYKRTEIKL